MIGCIFVIITCAVLVVVNIKTMLFDFDYFYGGSTATYKAWQSIYCLFVSVAIIDAIRFLYENWELFAK